MKSSLHIAFLMLGPVLHAQTWLSFPAANGYVAIGDLDVPGNQLTVEALYSSTSPASVDLVSKHSSPSDVNYLLRQTHAELTTASGFAATPSTCGPDQNTCRHAAMVYDGATLRFYLSGQLNGQVAMSGNMAQNAWQTLIGNYGCCFAGEQFYGYIDEVRIWNVARTQAQIQANMTTSLPSPGTQPGLLAYYSFSSTINLQGNPAFDGILAGTGSIAQSNPFCATLSPLCAILGPGFDRFTWEHAADGIRFQWEWRDEPPHRFELQAGPSPESVQPLLQLPGNETGHILTDLPIATTWFRLAAIDANGQMVLSNAVEYRPASQTPALQLAGRGNAVVARTALPGMLQWRFIDPAGRVQAQGSQFVESEMEIPAPAAAGVLLFEAVCHGSRAHIWLFSHR